MFWFGRPEAQNGGEEDGTKHYGSQRFLVAFFYGILLVGACAYVVFSARDAYGFAHKQLSRASSRWESKLHQEEQRFTEATRSEKYSAPTFSALMGAYIEAIKSGNYTLASKYLIFPNQSWHKKFLYDIVKDGRMPKFIEFMKTIQIDGALEKVSDRDYETLYFIEKGGQFIGSAQFLENRWWLVNIISDETLRFK